MCDDNEPAVSELGKNALCYYPIDLLERDVSCMIQSTFITHQRPFNCFHSTYAKPYRNFEPRFCPNLEERQTALLEGKTMGFAEKDEEFCPNLEGKTIAFGEKNDIWGSFCFFVCFECSYRTSISSLVKHIDQISLES